MSDSAQIPGRTLEDSIRADEELLELAGLSEPAADPAAEPSSTAGVSFDKKGARPFHVPDAPPGPLSRRNKKNPHRRISRIGLDANGQFSYRDLSNLPPLEIDSDGFPLRPAAVQEKTRRNFTMEQRKVRFVLIWSYTAGNVLLACQEAGVTRKVSRGWESDPVFVECLKEAREDIADRIKFRLAQRVGLIRAGKVVIHDAALFALLKKYAPEMLTDAPVAEEGSGEPAKAESNIPRPAR